MLKRCEKQREEALSSVSSLIESRRQYFYSRDQIAKGSGFSGALLDYCLRALVTSGSLVRVRLLMDEVSSVQYVYGDADIFQHFPKLLFDHQGAGNIVLSERSSDDVIFYLGRLDNESKQASSRPQAPVSSIFELAEALLPFGRLQPLA